MVVKRSKHESVERIRMKYMHHTYLVPATQIMISYSRTQHYQHDIRMSSIREASAIGTVQSRKSHLLITSKYLRDTTSGSSERLYKDIEALKIFMSTRQH